MTTKTIQAVGRWTILLLGWLILSGCGESKEDRAMKANNRGLAYYDKGAVDLAVGDYNEAIRLKPKFAEAYNNRGAAYYDRGELDA
ncbi:MAG: tetratricopeptide repeat protein, partial [Planctomycetales bacterium]